MDNNKYLTIREIKKILRDLNDSLDNEINLKHINFEKTQPKATSMDKIIVDTSHSSFDRFSHYVIKDDEHDLKIISIIESINSYQELLTKRLKSIALANRTHAEVIRLREDEKYASENDGKPMPWNLISEKVGYTERQCKRIWKEYLNS